MPAAWKVLFAAFCLISTAVAVRDRRQNGEDSNENSVGDKPWENPDHPDYIAASWNYTDHKLAETVEQMMKRLMPTVIRSSSSVELSGPCMAALFKMMLGIRQGKLWANRIVDAWGKPGAGMLVGNLGHVGDYDECVDTVIPDLKDLDGNHQVGKYCLATFVPLLPKKPIMYTLFHQVPELINITKKNTSFAETARNAHWLYFLELRMGVCMPSVCTENDVYNIMEQIPKHAQVKGTTKIVNCETKQYFKPNNDQIAVIAVCGVVGLFLLLGTAIDVITVLKQGDNPEPLSITEKGYYKFLVCFSVYTNYLKLINVKTKEENKHLSAVNGMRFITVTWVIVGHSYLYADYNLMMQANRLSLLPPDFWFQVVANSMLTVDTFILMSGMLVTYGVVKSQEKRKGLNVFMYIFHRFWRLTPPYAMTIAFLLASPILGSGPVWKITLEPFITNCKANWWTNLLYVNNYVNTYDFCLEHTWYLGVDMQLHILALFVLLPLIRWPKLGAVVGIILAVGFSAVAAIVNLIHDLPPSPLGLFPDPDDRVYVEVPNYFKPYGHVGPYMVGMLLGYILVKKPKIVIPRTLRVSGWLFFATLQLVDLYGAYPWNNNSIPGPTVSALYAGTSKTVWALGIAWVLFVCCTGNGGVVNDILSWKAWIPMARLSYMFYLIHPIVIWVHEAMGHSRMYTSHYFWVYNILGHYMVSMVLALIMSLSFEAPFLAMEKIIFGGGSREDGDRPSGTPPPKKVPELPAYDSEMRSSRTFAVPKHGHSNGGYRNGGDGLYKATNGQYRGGTDNGAFCRL
ncbi:LOW QUALITY PROTEIN: nose resistant to fluoxetine protein 6-like [Uloborus diversus]|uniref:LOW QUALITY PROTEIN: nose resistant to fluoxetine protein 6-like n=1 Tax=Uloborus diversus TaxID=327109 RepID=UPI002409A6AE|nr:LOW QUALITY PROTEIN: nose resistant to fluoxetine protein 6-like [Uloborus diversus]